MSGVDIKKLSTVEFIIFIHSIQVASGILTMPGAVARVAGPDGWISIIFGWLITSIVGIMIVKIVQIKPNLNFCEILKFYFGKWMGTVLILLYALYLLYAGFNTILKAIEIVKVWIFPMIPSYQIAILLLSPFLILIPYGIIAVARYSISIFLLTAFLPLILLFSLKNNFNFLFLLPVLEDGILPVFKGIEKTITPFAGLETVYFVYPLLKQKEKAILGVVIANTGTMFLYLFVTIICYIYFSSKEIQEIIWPALLLLKSIHFSFLERLEIVYISYYLIVFSSTIYSYLYLSGDLLKSVTQKYSNRILVIYVTIIVFVFFFYSPEMKQMSIMYSIMDNLNIIFFLILPFLFFIYVSIASWKMRGRSI
ncbi:GerAB/ArcD/ProY family transporter [Bacillus cereus]|uniref:GerAB/ArcD/ProY family transporter n=1 Tax=Bacillus cereus TaxID=1396 RepID=UPI000BF8C0B5|nr:endospore germination permease [Bacillus cereus]PFN17576.1 spore gernimation protein XA [Bacillus cereus]